MVAVSVMHDFKDKGTPPPPGHNEGDNVATVRPSESQRRYLARGLDEPGGKLPIFNWEGRAAPRKTVEACITHGWAEPWFANPLKPDWLVFKLTPAGYRVLGKTAGHDRTHASET